jgi:hypothetical protein
MGTIFGASHKGRIQVLVFSGSTGSTVVVLLRHTLVTYFSGTDARPLPPKKMRI